MPRKQNPNKATYDPTRRQWKKRLPTGSAGPRFVIARTEAQCLEKWRIATGKAPVRLRPGSVAEFVELHGFWAYSAARMQQSSLDRYKLVWNNHVGPNFGTVRFDEITYTLAQERIALCGKSTSSKELSKTVLLQIVAMAKASGVATDAAMQSIKNVRLEPRVPKQRINIVPRCQAVLDKSAGTYMYGPLWLMFTLGLRWGEVCGLQVQDLSDGVLTVCRQRNEYGLSYRLKSKKVGTKRMIGLPKAMEAKLRGLINGDVFMFHGPNGAPIPYDHGVRQLKPFQVSKEDPVTLHDFRSAAICQLYGQADNKTVGKLFGHAAIDQTREYLDTDTTAMREALERITLQ